MKVVRASFICTCFAAALIFGQNLREAPENTRLIPSIDGADLYKAYCASCHGLDGKGAGPMAAELKARLPDLTRIARRNRGTFPLERVERVISGEEEITPAHGSREMPMWGPIFSQIVWDRDLGRLRIHNLAKYLEKLQE